MAQLSQTNSLKMKKELHRNPLNGITLGRRGTADDNNNLLLIKSTSLIVAFDSDNLDQFDHTNRTITLSVIT